MGLDQVLGKAFWKVLVRSLGWLEDGGGLSLAAKSFTHSTKLLSCPWGRDPRETWFDVSVRTQHSALYSLQAPRWAGLLTSFQTRFFRVRDLFGDFKHQVNILGLYELSLLVLTNYLSLLSLSVSLSLSLSVSPPPFIHTHTHTHTHHDSLSICHDDYPENE